MVYFLLILNTVKNTFKLIYMYFMYMYEDLTSYAFSLKPQEPD